MKKVYHLSTCSTCKRILNEINTADFLIQDVKNEAITETQLNEMHRLSLSHEDLFNKRAIKYRSMGLNNKKLNEADFRSLLLEEYTFLKRPVFIVHNKIFIGNSKKNIEALKTALANE